MPMHYPPLADGTYRYGDPPRPLPSPVPGPEPTAPPHPFPHESGASPHLPQHEPPPPNGPPGDGPPAGQSPPGRGGNGVAAAAAIVGGLALVVVAVLVFALFGPGSGSGRGAGDPLRGPLPPQAAPAPDRAPGDSFTAEGRFTVMSSPGEPVSGDGSGCELPVSLSDLGEGTRITLSGGISTATALGSSLLAYDGGDLSSCTFTFSFDEVPSGVALYLVEIPGRGQLTYTEDELRAGIDITLGR